MPRHNMPDDWEPPVPAWSVNFGGCPSLAVAYYGVQSHNSDIADSDAAFALVRSGRLERPTASLRAAHPDELDLLLAGGPASRA
jgi:hypothetical protein